MKAEMEDLRKRVFRIEVMMYIVLAKLGVDVTEKAVPFLTTIWRALW